MLHVPVCRELRDMSVLGVRCAHACMCVCVCVHACAFVRACVCEYVCACMSTELRKHAPARGGAVGSVRAVPLPQLA